MSEKNTRRLFLGTFLTPEDQSRIVDGKRTLEPLLAQWNCKLRWVKPEKLHMTWLFMGDCDLETENAIIATIEKMVACSSPTDIECASAFSSTDKGCAPASSPENKEELSSAKYTIDFDSFDFFPNQKRAKLMALLPTAVSPELMLRVKGLRKVLLPFCQKTESEDFNPHITIFRFPRDNRQRFVLPEGIDKTVFGSVQLSASQLCLIHSHFGSDGDDYRILREFEFATS